MQEQNTFTRQKDALAWLHQHFGKPYPSSGKFSTDCRDGLCLRQSDKSYRLKDLEAYAKRIQYDSGAAKTTATLAAEREGLEIKILEQKVKKGELENRKADRAWISREVVFEREGALVGQIMGEARHHLSRAVPAVILAAKGDPDRAPEIKKLIEEALFSAFRALYETGEVDQTFLDEEED